MELNNNQREEKRQPRICRCVAPPMGSLFDKDGIYRWDYGLNCIIVFQGHGSPWCGSEDEFAKRFRRLRRKAK